MTTPNIPPRWYMITKDGVATLCVDEYDARQNVIDADILYPNNAPHVAVQLAPVQPAMPADAEDAARYRWMRRFGIHGLPQAQSILQCQMVEGGEGAMDAAIDARRRIEGEL